MGQPRSIRFDDHVVSGLAAFVARRPGLSGSAAASLLVDEGLRMDAHPGVIFRDGPAGRRAVLVAGPDIWAVIAAIQDARKAEPELASDALLALVSTNSGIGVAALRTALDYYGTYPQEVDAIIAQDRAARDSLLAAADRTRGLLGA